MNSIIEAKAADERKLHTVLLLSYERSMCMQQRKLEELNLIDDFLFFKMLENEVIGEEFGRYLLEIIFDRKIGKLKVIPQKVYYGSNTDKHGIRLDVYMEEELSNDTLLREATIYDIEPEADAKKSKKESIPRRVRFYHSTIDVRSLGAGKDYKDLKKVIVVMIMPFDPFGYDQMIYTIQNQCLEVPELPYDDGAKTMFLYTKGTKGNPTARLRELLHYLEDTKPENVKNEDLRAIHNLVKVVKQDAEVSREYMKWYERDQMIKEEGIEEGLQKGLQKGELIGMIKTARKYGATDSEIIKNLICEYQLSEQEAVKLINEI